MFIQRAVNDVFSPVSARNFDLLLETSVDTRDNHN